jgi:hypothetical protein
MELLCSIRHKWSAWEDCNVEDGDNVLASVAHYRECARCHRKQVSTYWKGEFEVNHLLYEVNKKQGEPKPARMNPYDVYLMP